MDDDPALPVPEDAGDSVEALQFILVTRAEFVGSPSRYIF